METERLTAISDYYQLALLNLYKITPNKTQFNGRYIALFNERAVQEILDQYENGSLQVCARDFVSAIQRIKTKIFSLEKNGNEYGDSYLGEKNRR